MLLFDQNLSSRLTELLADVYPGCVHVQDCNLSTANDNEVWEYAKHHKLCIITKDSDFNNLQRNKGFPPKIIWLRLGNCSSQQILNTLGSVRIEILSFLENEKLGILEIF